MVDPHNFSESTHNSGSCKFLTMKRVMEIVPGNCINGFLEKNIVWDEWATWSPKLAHLCNSGSTLRIFFGFPVMAGRVL